MKKISCIQLFLPIALALFAWACSDFKDSSSQNFTELDKTPIGTWKVSKATRNGEDITKFMNFSEFTLTIAEDGSYTLNDVLPFLVKRNGNWSLDNPQYPFLIYFRENASNESIDIPFIYMPFEGKRKMTLSFTTEGGCFRNVYSYTFLRDE